MLPVQPHNYLKWLKKLIEHQVVEAAWWQIQSDTKGLVSFHTCV